MNDITYFNYHGNDRVLVFKFSSVLKKTYNIRSGILCFIFLDFYCRLLYNILSSYYTMFRGILFFMDFGETRIRRVQTEPIISSNEVTAFTSKFLIETADSIMGTFPNVSLQENAYMYVG